MRSLRRIAAWTLLTIIVALLVPGERWHALGHDEHASEHATHGHAVSASCGQCEAGMPVAIASEAIARTIQVVTRGPLPAEAVQGTCLGFTFLTADRGPPVIC